MNYIGIIKAETQIQNIKLTMDKSHIFVIALVAAVLAFRLYTRFMKKKTNTTAGKNRDNSEGPAISDDDDYEPYSGK